MILSSLLEPSRGKTFVVAIIETGLLSSTLTLDDFLQYATEFNLHCCRFVNKQVFLLIFALQSQTVEETNKGCNEVIKVRCRGKFFLQQGLKKRLQISGRIFLSSSLPRIFERLLLDTN